MISKPGFYDLTEAEYHADPVHAPSLSSSIAKVMVDETPLHASLRHPRLTKQDEDTDATRAREIGTAAHKIILGRGVKVQAIDAADYRSKDAKELRAALYAGGIQPILRDDLTKASNLAGSVNRALAKIDGCARFADPHAGKAEQVLIWQDIGGPMCRAMIDWLDVEETTVWDVKTTAAGLSDRSIANLISGGYDLSAAFYIRGLSQLLPNTAGRWKFRWIFVEQDEPHEVRVIQADGATLALGDKKAAFAIELWRRCMEAKSFPGYPRKIQRIDYPAYAETRWLERELVEEEISSKAKVIL